MWVSQGVCVCVCARALMAPAAARGGVARWEHTHTPTCTNTTCSELGLVLVCLLSTGFTAGFTTVFTAARDIQIVDVGRLELSCRQLTLVNIYRCRIYNCLYCCTWHSDSKCPVATSHSLIYTCIYTYISILYTYIIHIYMLISKDDFNELVWNKLNKKMSYNFQVFYFTKFGNQI